MKFATEIEEFSKRLISYPERGFEGVEIGKIHEVASKANNILCRETIMGRKIYFS